jgi:hypothetical protein
VLEVEVSFVPLDILELHAAKIRAIAGIKPRKVLFMVVVFE